MFAVLTILPGEKTWKGRLLERFRKPIAEIENVPVTEGKSFYNITAKPHRGKIPWFEIKKQAEKAEKIVPPFDLKLPEEYGFDVFCPKLLPKLMLFNSATEYIKKQNVNPKESGVTVIDNEGIYLNLIEKLVSLSASITVVTKAQKEYERLSSKMMADFGLSLVISESFDESALLSRFVVAYDSESVPLVFDGTVLSLQKKRLMHGSSLIGGGITLPKVYEELWPGNVNKLHFASALYELCGVKELEKLSFDEMCS